MNELKLISMEDSMDKKVSSKNEEDVKIKDMQWKDPEIFNIYESARKIFRPLNKKIVEEIFEEYINRNDKKIIEVGSGIGEMASIVPEDIEKRMIHSERNPVYSKIQKENRKEREVIDADIEKLPFKNDSADIMAGYAMFDTLFNTEKSAEEIKRVLKENGKFVHFLDLGHNPDTLITDYKNQGKIVFPAIDMSFPGMADDNYKNFCCASEKEIEEVLEKIGEKDPYYEIIKNYIEDPLENYHCLSVCSPDILEEMMLRINKEGVLFPTFDSSLYFQKKMEKVFKDLDFKILKNEIVSKKERVERDERFDSEPEYYNNFRNRIGKFSKMERDVPNDKVDIEAFVHVFVAQKG